MSIISQFNVALRTNVVVILSTILLSACSTADIRARDSLDYRGAIEANPLELPPSLAGQKAQGQRNKTSYNEYVRNVSQERVTERVLPVYQDVKLLSNNGQNYLSVQGSSDRVWNSMLDLLTDLGMGIETKDANAGLIETKWAENRAAIPDNFVRTALGKVGLDGIYSSSLRDMYRIRLERDGQNILVFVTHYGLKDKTTGRNGEFHTWVERPRDPELEIALLKRLQSKLGSS